MNTLYFIIYVSETGESEHEICNTADCRKTFNSRVMIVSLAWELKCI